MRPIAELRNVSKSFYGVSANAGISLEIYPHEVHGLLGENGAGKSTLCSILSGLYQPDEGHIVVDAQPIKFRSPRHALDAGIGMVYQHFRLVKSLTVAENVVLGREGTPRILRRQKLEQSVQQLIDDYGFTIDARARVGDLSVGEQQRVEILRLLARDVRILILDEPTAVLAPTEALSLFKAIRALAQRGIAIVLITHRMEEILQETDRITVLRHGMVTATMRTAAADASLLARAMMGREVTLPERDRSAIQADNVFQVKNLTVEGIDGTDRVVDVSFDIRGGEVLGIVGVAGNGQRELADALTGLRRTKTGTVLLGVQADDITHASVQQRIKRGIAYIPEDRLGTGVAGGLPLPENMVLRSFASVPISRRGVLSSENIRRVGRNICDEFDVRGASASLPVRWLSGGNIQKAIVGRELRSKATLIIACSPTRGLDLGTVAAVRAFIFQVVAEGVAVLLISEDLNELLELSDRVMVMHRGRLKAEFAPEDVDLETLGLLMTGQQGLAK